MSLIWHKFEKCSKCAMLTVTGVVAYVIKNVFSRVRNTDSACDMSSRSAARKLFHTVGPSNWNWRSNCWLSSFHNTPFYLLNFLIYSYLLSVKFYHTDPTNYFIYFFTKYNEIQPWMVKTMHEFTQHSWSNWIDWSHKWTRTCTLCNTH